jgi:hypothetical protein
MRKTNCEKIHIFIFKRDQEATRTPDRTYLDVLEFELVVLHQYTQVEEDLGGKVQEFGQDHHQTRTQCLEHRR